MPDPALSRSHWERNARRLEKDMSIFCVIAMQGRRHASPLSRLMILTLLLPLMGVYWLSIKALIHVVPFDKLS